MGSFLYLFAAVLAYGMFFFGASVCSFGFRTDVGMPIQYDQGLSNVSNVISTYEVQEPQIKLYVNVTAAIEEDRKRDVIVIRGSVHWHLNPNLLSKVGEYFLRVDPLSESPRCSEYFISYFKHLNKATTYINIPHEEMSQEPRILNFRCSYRVQLQLRPCIKKQQCLDFATNFTIGECVGSVCECTDQSSPSPPDYLEAVFRRQSDDEEKILILWTYSNNDSALSLKFKIYIYEIVHYRNVARDVPLPYVVVPYDPTERIFTCNVSISNRTSETQYAVEVAVQDQNTCESNAIRVIVSKENSSAGNQIVNAELQVDPAPSLLEIVIICVGSVGAAIAFVAAVVLYAWRRKKKQQRRAHIQALQQARIEYQSSSSSCVTQTTYLSTLREDFNLLYVEQEIQEARDKGQVDCFEISYTRLTVGPEIGKGAFGRVCVATAEAIAGIPGKIKVAVKYLRDNASSQEKEDFLEEIKMMKSAGRNENVVAMLACCILREPHCMVMEFIAYGDLLTYLRKLRSEYEKVTGTLIGLCNTDKVAPLSNRRNSCYNGVTIKYESLLHADDDADTILNSSSQSYVSEATDETELMTSGDTEKNGEGRDGPEVNTIDDELVVEKEPASCLDAVELQSFALQIARGMKHLANRGIVHRDLAARNVLINENKILKISDFGLSRTGTYVTNRGGRVPLRWLSIEAFRDHTYSSQSDVWAFGVVLWEICTLGGFPYSAISDVNLFAYLLNNNRLEQPVHCSEDLYAVMKSCWRAESSQRPKFVDLCSTLENLGRQSHTYVNFDVKYKTCDSTNPLPPAQEN